MPYGSDPPGGHRYGGRRYGDDPPGAPGGSHWAVTEAPDAVWVGNQRAPLGPVLRFTRDQWSEVLRAVAAGRLPAGAREIGHVVKVTAPDSGGDALFFWPEEMAAFTTDVRTGRYGPVPADEPGHRLGGPAEGLL